VEDQKPAHEERPAHAPAQRRARLGARESGMSYSPAYMSSSRVPDEDIVEEVAALAAALDEAGPEGLERRVLGERVNCRRWGPGRYRHALSVAQERGAIRRSGRGRFVAEEGATATR
jgi:hypothetical protein